MCSSDLLERVVRYNELLDLEVENNSAAEIYVKESNEALVKIGRASWRERV